MDSNDGGKAPPPPPPLPYHHRHHCHHRHRHHHFYYISPNCPFHKSILEPSNHSAACSFSASYPSLQVQNPEPFASADVNDDAIMIADGEIEKLESEEEDEEPIFVLTDEWREFFAKSEAKRKQAMKQQLKKGKK